MLTVNVKMDTEEIGVRRVSKIFYLHTEYKNNMPRGLVPVAGQVTIAGHHQLHLAIATFPVISTTPLWTNNKVKTPFLTEK